MNHLEPGPEPESEPEPEQAGFRRRGFLATTAGAAGAMAVTAGAATPRDAPAAPGPPEEDGPGGDGDGVAFTVNGRAVALAVDARVTLLDALRERLNLTGTKKGCDRGQCGACTVHIEGRRVLACLTLVGSVRDREVTTIEGLADGERLHPMQQAFIDCDGLQCGFCTPGQVMSAVGLVREGRARSDDEIREHMSGNICRCSAYPHIVDAVRKGAR
ncbi:(2Fe-2S)-binding protein [Streptomyces sp. NPDC093252]|uniref:(2Fe-2S)-binding protein n=1 Tax=Streptomyces sp. NPDC093252 TaxID=3154980 RepID=UPI003423E2FE